MDVEIPFIPAPQRSIKVSNEEQETIVVVGQTRQKRKRPKVSPVNDGVDATSGKKTKVINGAEAKDDEDDGEAAFDFSAVPNILHDNPNMAIRRRRRQRRNERER
jgi:exosome complex exonuclease RRP6